MDLKNCEVTKKTVKRKQQETVKIKECQCMSAVGGTSSTVDGANSTEDGMNSPDGAQVVIVGPNAMWDLLSDNVWFHIFYYLPSKDLSSALHVCKRWKELVQVHLKSRHQQAIDYFKQDIILPSDASRVLDRCGWCLTKLAIRDANNLEKRPYLLMMIGDFCPNLVELSILGDIIVDDVGLVHLALNCNKLQYFDMLIRSCYSNEGLGFLLRTLTHLKRLRITCPLLISIDKGCFIHIGPMIEDLEFKNIFDLPRSLFLDLSGKLNNLRRLSLQFVYNANKLILDGFSEACANLRQLSITRAKMNSEGLIEISKLWRLETLDFSLNFEVNDHSIKLLFYCFPLLKAFRMAAFLNSQISDAGIIHIVDCCSQLVDLDISGNHKVTDSTLVAVAKCGIVRRLVVRRCSLITDIGCIHLVTRCPQLETLDISGCCDVTGAILYPSLTAVKNRRDKQPLKLKIAAGHCGSTYMLDFVHEDIHLGPRITKVYTSIGDLLRRMI